MNCAVDDFQYAARSKFGGRTLGGFEHRRCLDARHAIGAKARGCCATRYHTAPLATRPSGSIVRSRILTAGAAVLDRQLPITRDGILDDRQRVEVLRCAPPAGRVDIEALPDRLRLRAQRNGQRGHEFVDRAFGGSGEPVVADHARLRHQQRTELRFGEAWHVRAPLLVEAPAARARRAARTPEPRPRSTPPCRGGRSAATPRVARPSPVRSVCRWPEAEAGGEQSIGSHGCDWSLILDCGPGTMTWRVIYLALRSLRYGAGRCRI